MPTITIPKKALRDKELIAVPRSDYEEYLSWKRIKIYREVALTPRQKKILARARKNLAQGKYLTLEQLENALGYKS